MMAAFNNTYAVHVTDYKELTTNTNQCMKQILQFLALDSEVDALNESLQLSKTTLSPPNPDKWRKHEAEIEALKPQWQVIESRIQSFRKNL